MLDDAQVSQVLVVTAHPDDVDFGAAGTVARWTATGVRVTYLVVTDGDAGGFDPAVDRAMVPGIRRAEQRAAAREVGVVDVRFLNEGVVDGCRYRDGALEVSSELRRDITRVIRQVRPERMLIHSPERDWARIAPSHPDHLAAGEAAIRAVYPDARNPFAHPELLDEEGLAPWTVREVWLSGHPGAGHVVDVTDTFERKVAALRAHASQTAHLPDLEGMVRGWLAETARRAGLPAGRLAEPFHVVDTG